MYICHGNRTCHSSYTHWSISCDIDGEGSDNNDHTISHGIRKECIRTPHPYFSI